MKKTNHEKKKNSLCKLILAVVAITVLTLPSVAFAQEFTVEKKDAAYNEPDYSPLTRTCTRRTRSTPVSREPSSAPRQPTASHVAKR